MHQLTSEEQQLVEAAKDYAANHVQLLANSLDRGDADNRALLAAAARVGLLRIEVPVEHGGLGYSFACKRRVAEVIAAADFGMAMAVINTHNVANHLARAAAPELARQYVPALVAGERAGCTALTEPGAGSDFSAITTLARAQGDAWILDGEKHWIVNATHADVMVVYAQTGRGSGAKGIAAFVVDGTRDGVTRAAPLHSAAARSIDAGGFVLSGYRANANACLHAPGEAFKAAMTSINGARAYVAAMCCGMVARCLHISSRYGAQRQSFGAPLHGHQGWRWRLADAAIELEAAQLLVDAAAACIDAGVDAQIAAAKAKVFATRMAATHISSLMHAMGAEGLREAHPFVRHLGAAQVAALVDGSTEMLLERLARSLRPSV